MTYSKLVVQLKALENIPWIMPVTAAEEIAEIARDLAPVDTGELKSKIKAEHLSKYSQVVAKAKHSGYQEFGTYKMQAHPYLRPAVDNYQRQVQEAVKEALIGEIQVAVRGGWVPAEYRPLPNRPKKRSR